MYQRLLVFICKVLIKVLRLAGKNGSALPGLIIERLNPNFLDTSLQEVQSKIILVTGTNGKTTTTKMLVAALRGTGVKVVTNATGSNMTRGLIAALIEDMTYFGSLKETDWFVFEMDEAYAPIFTENISPKMVVGLNVLRDQLDRYGEIDITAKLIAAAATKSEHFVFNELDPLLSSAAKSFRNEDTKISSFGVSSALSGRVSNEQSLHGGKTSAKSSNASVVLKNVSELGDMQQLTVSQEANEYDFVIPVKGFHNALNAAAVVAALVTINPSEVANGLKALAGMPTPFGRGEKLHFNGKNITVALVKNPSGFMSNLETFVKQAKPQLVLFAVNDKLADGRDVSWLWDVEFSSMITKQTQLRASGVRAYDMALRLKHDGFDVNTTTDIAHAVQELMKSDYTEIAIVPTYTALFEVRAALAKYGRVPRIW